MGKTNAKGEIGEAMILADLQRQGHGIAIPFGHDLPFDLIVVRKENGALEKVQCKYTTSNGRVVVAKVTSTLSVGDIIDTPRKRSTGSPSTTRPLISASISLRDLGWPGRQSISVSTPTVNGQAKGIRFAQDFTRLIGRPSTDPHLAQGTRRLYHWVSRRSSSVVEQFDS